MDNKQGTAELTVTEPPRRRGRPPGAKNIQGTAKPKAPRLSRINVLVPECVHETIRIDAIRERTTVASLVSEAISMYSLFLRKAARAEAAEWRQAHKELVAARILHIGILEERKRKKKKRRRGLDWRTKRTRAKFPGMNWRAIAAKAKAAVDNK